MSLSARLYLILVALFICGALAQEGGKTFKDRFSDVWDKIKQISTGASDVCNNNFVAGGLVQKVFCGDLVPKEVTDFIKLEDGFGPQTPWCGGLACAFRGMGCKEATYSVEAEIIRATGKEESCLERTGLDPKHCITIAKYVSKVPPMLEARKRAEHAKEVEAAAHLPREEPVVTDELLHQGRMMLRSMYPDLAAERNNFGLADDETWENYMLEKRNIGDTLLEQAQICNPLIGTVIDIIVQQTKLPFNISSLFGPCGTACEYAVCGLVLMCGGPDHLGADPILNHVNRERQSRCANPTLRCDRWVEAPEDKCKDVTCVSSEGNYPEGYFTPSTCPLPKTIHTPSKATEQDCCERCDDKCLDNRVKCNVDPKPKSEWPQCPPYSFGKHKETDCCDQWINPCQGVECADPPTDCGPGKTLGPSSIGDCCLTCVSPCAGVSCAQEPRSQADCAQNERFEPSTMEKRAGLATAPNPQCAQCCNECIPGRGKPTDQTNGDTNAAASSALAASLATLALATAL